jgi:hypothetical protein
MAVLSYKFWQERLAADPHLVGKRSINLPVLLFSGVVALATALLFGPHRFAGGRSGTRTLRASRPTFGECTISIRTPGRTPRSD